jgi:hypothetical protein
MATIIFFALIIGYAVFIIMVLADSASPTPPSGEAEPAPALVQETVPAVASTASVAPERYAFFEQIGEPSRLRSPHVLDLRPKDE